MLNIHIFVCGALRPSRHNDANTQGDTWLLRSSSLYGYLWSVPVSLLQCPRNFTVFSNSNPNPTRKMNKSEAVMIIALSKCIEAMRHSGRILVGQPGWQMKWGQISVFPNMQQAFVAMAVHSLFA
ncbi:hypothetical protein ACH5RR_006653 [Cinchona calisaya]|uniref:Uncharacterized protein n=1 Tax=Cinchona calisaya TaxID=153742 RepID=A0ABD3APL7_9GENT